MYFHKLIVAPEKRMERETELTESAIGRLHWHGGEARVGGVLCCLWKPLGGAAGADSTFMTSLISTDSVGGALNRTINVDKDTTTLPLLPSNGFAAMALASSFANPSILYDSFLGQEKT